MRNFKMIMMMAFLSSCVICACSSSSGDKNQRIIKITYGNSVSMNPIFSMLAGVAYAASYPPATATFDENGLVTEVSLSTVVWKNYTYDDKNRVTRREIYSGGSRVGYDVCTYSGDDSDNYTMNHYNNGGVVCEVYTSALSSDGRTKTMTYTSGIMDRKFIWEYDSDGFISKYTQQLKTGSGSFTTLTTEFIITFVRTGLVVVGTNKSYVTGGSAPQPADGATMTFTYNEKGVMTLWEYNSETVPITYTYEEGECKVSEWWCTFVPFVPFRNPSNVSWSF